MSLVEAIANVAVGFGVAVTTQIAVFPLFGLHANLADNLLIGAIFTLVSIARSYTLRRLFESLRGHCIAAPLGEDRHRLETCADLSLDRHFR